MSIYLNAILMLAVTLAGFVLLAGLMQAVRSGRLAIPWRGGGGSVPASPRLVVEQAQVVDGKRRLVLLRCDEQRMLLLTGGPSDLLIALPPAPPAP